MSSSHSRFSASRVLILTIDRTFLPLRMQSFSKHNAANLKVVDITSSLGSRKLVIGGSVSIG